MVPQSGLHAPVGYGRSNDDDQVAHTTPVLPFKRDIVQILEVCG